MINGTSPPIQKAPTALTLSANKEATAASAALPPFSSISNPAKAAADLPAMTKPFWLSAFQSVICACDDIGE